MPESNSTPVVRPCKKCGAADRYADGDCKPCSRRIWKEWVANKPERVKELKDKWRSENKEKINADAKKWLSENIEKARESSNRWKYKNPETGRIYHQNRKARLENSGGVLSRDIAKTLFALQKGKCPCCNQPLGEDYHIDHITPLALGGANEDWNVQLLRKVCNLQKHAKHPVDFMQSRGFLL